MFLDSGYTLAVMSNVDAGAFDVTDSFKAMLQSRLEDNQQTDTWEQVVPPPKSLVTPRRESTLNP